MLIYSSMLVNRTDLSRKETGLTCLFDLLTFVESVVFRIKILINQSTYLCNCNVTVRTDLD